MCEFWKWLGLIAAIPLAILMLVELSKWGFDELSSFASRIKPYQRWLWLDIAAVTVSLAIYGAHCQ